MVDEAQRHNGVGLNIAEGLGVEVAVSFFIFLEEHVSNIR